MKAIFKDGRLVDTCSDEDAAAAIENGTADSMLTVDPNEVAQLSERRPTLGQKLQSQINTVARTLDECATDLVERAPALCDAAKDKVISYAKKIKAQGEEALEQLRIVAHEATSPVEDVPADEAPVEATVDAPDEQVDASAEVPVAEVVEEIIPE